MANIYLDNAATTALRPALIQEMAEVMQQHYGNPSSIHSLGRTTRSLIEQSRKIIVKLLNVTPSEI